MSTGWLVLAAVLVGLAVVVGAPGRRWFCDVGGSRRTTRPGRSAGAAPRPVTQQDVLGMVELVASQVRAGASPVSAWRAAADVLGLTAAAAPLAWCDAASRLVGRGHVATAAAAAAIAAAWRLADRTGAPLADLLDAVAHSLREEAVVAGEVAVALAGPRATVRLLTALPFAGLLLGQVVGAHPFAVLLGTAPGRACAALGLVLLVAGRQWMRRLVRAVESTA